MTTMNKAASRKLQGSDCLHEGTSMLGAVVQDRGRTPGSPCDAARNRSREWCRECGVRGLSALAGQRTEACCVQQMGPACKRMSLALAVLLIVAVVIAVPALAREEPEQARVCRPLLAKAPLLQLSQTGVFRWNCSSRGTTGESYYIVFVRPSGTYILLKVPDGKTEFEFTPDAEGQWRWIVINTDPDRTKPDVESEPGSFTVTPMPGISP